MYRVPAILKILLKNAHNLKFTIHVKNIPRLFSGFIHRHRATFSRLIYYHVSRHTRVLILFPKTLIRKSGDESIDNPRWCTSDALLATRPTFTEKLGFRPGYMVYEVSSVNSMKRVFILTAKDTKESVVLSIFWNPQNP